MKQIFIPGGDLDELVLNFFYFPFVPTSPQNVCEFSIICVVESFKGQLQMREYMNKLESSRLPFDNEILVNG